MTQRILHLDLARAILPVSNPPQVVARIKEVTEARYGLKGSHQN